MSGTYLLGYSGFLTIFQKLSDTSVVSSKYSLLISSVLGKNVC